MMAWHYTTGEKFVRIMESGLLLLTSVHVVPPERPILWFSLNQYWENTANKGILDGGVQRWTSMRELFERAHGLVRYGRAPRGLLMGRALRRKAHMKPEIWRGLCNAAKQRHADPSEWCGTVEPILVDGLVIEVANDALQWERVRSASGAVTT